MRRVKDRLHTRPCHLHPRAHQSAGGCGHGLRATQLQPRRARRSRGGGARWCGRRPRRRGGRWPSSPTCRGPRCASAASRGAPSSCSTGAPFVLTARDVPGDQRHRVGHLQAAAPRREAWRHHLARRRPAAACAWSASRTTTCTAWSRSAARSPTTRGSTCRAAALSAPALTEKDKRRLRICGERAEGRLPGALVRAQPRGRARCPGHRAGHAGDRQDREAGGGDPPGGHPGRGRWRDGGARRPGRGAGLREGARACRSASSAR